MRTLNLINLEKSDIKYKISNFPDGQQDIVLDPSFVFHSGTYDEINIHSRFNSFLDLEIIIAATKALKRLKFKDINLYIPYLLGARSDRAFQEGGNSYLVDVVAPIINAQHYNKVTVLDAHSDVAAACIENLFVVDNYDLIHFGLNDINNGKYRTRQEFSNNDCVFISPDAGASKKVYKLSGKIGFEGEIIIASKFRDTEGNLSKTDVPIVLDKHGGKDFVIIDDICDGGRTFINIAKAIRDKTADGKIYLFVTHGIFSAGLKELSQYFDMIYTTNSIRDNEVDTEFWSRNDKYLHKIKQINVF